MRPDGSRDPVAGPDSGPEPPYPIRLSGPVIKGFGRGSKELGIPTANIPADGLSDYPSLETGVYYGVVSLDPARFAYSHVEAAAAGQPIQSSTAPTETDGGSTNVQTKNDIKILPAVLSIGYNPFYKNEVKSIEIHVMPPLTSPSPTSTENSTQQTTFFKLPDFYSTHLNLLILGYIRPEYDYVSREALIEDIRIDCEVARSSLMRDGYAGYLVDEQQIDTSRIVDDNVKKEREWLQTF